MCSTNNCTNSPQPRVIDPHELMDVGDAFNAPAPQDQRPGSSTASRDLILYDSYPGPASGQVIDIMVPRDRGARSAEPSPTPVRPDSTTSEQLPALHQWLLRLSSSPIPQWKAEPR